MTSAEDKTVLAQPENGEVLLVGSSQDCDVTIRDASISPHHLELRRLSKLQFRLRDVNSEQGTYVKGQRVKIANVHRDDIIQIGSRPVEIRWLASHFSDTYLVVEPIEQASAFTSSSLLIGQKPPADIILQYPDIAYLHAEIKLEANGNILISDKGSSKGTFVNGIQVKSWMLLTPQDKLYLGSYRIKTRTLEDWLEQLRAIAMLSTVDEPTETELGHEQTASIDFSDLPTAYQNTLEKIDIPEHGSLLIGRDPSCQVTLNHPSVSWQHAKLQVRKGILTLLDLNSSNGTFVDGQRITKTEVSSNSWIRIGTVVIYLNDGRVTTTQMNDDEIRLDVVNISKKLPSGKTILNDFSFSIYPGEIVALMGPSGAGKTALLECLTGHHSPTKGKIYLNGRSLHQHWDEFRHLMGYVPQEDVMHRDITVYEALYYAAKMRLPRDLPEEKIVETVERVLTRMGMAHIRDSIIGDERVRGISGGQRKRVNIALELLTEPKIIFLDEPTSGLDATSTLEILQILRSLANSGTTIILTIHQPRVEAYRLIDNVILLVTGGRLAYYGPAFPDAPEYFSGFFPKYAYKKENNPADYLLDMLDLNSAIEHFDWQKEFTLSPYYTRFVQNRLSQRKELQHNTEKKRITKRSVLVQFSRLFSRYTIRKLRDRSSLLIQLLQTPVIGGILAWLFWEEGNAMQNAEKISGIKMDELLSLIQLQNGVHPTLFLLAAAAFWFGCSNVAREIVSDRAIYLRERRTGLRSSAYLASIFAYQFILAGIQTFLIAVIIWPAVELHSNFFLGWAILTLIAACGISLGLLVSASSRTEVTAISTIPLLLLPQLMLGGFIKRYGELMLTHNGVQDNLSDLMPLRWAFEAIINLEYQSLLTIPEHNLYSIDYIIGFAARSSGLAVLALLAFTMIFLILTQIRLQFLETER